MAPLTPLRSPTAYFRRGDRPFLSLAAVVVFAEALAITVLVWLFMQRVIARIDLTPAESAQTGNAVTGAMVAVFVGVFVGWVVLAAIMHVFLWFADADRGFATTLAVLGEAELVGIALVPLTAVGLFSLAGNVPQDPGAATAYVQRATSSSTPLLLLSSLVGTAWKAAIQGLGLAAAHDVDRDKTLALAFVLGFLGFLVNLV